MEPCKNLPKNYSEELQLNLQTNRKLRYGITLSAIAVCLIMGIYGNRIQPLRRCLKGSLDQVAYAFIGIILYMILHEVVHGIFMHIFGRERAHYGVHGPFTFASSRIYFHKFQYLIIALAPVLIWGITLGILCHYNLHTDWFWTFYFIEIVNLSGAVSDLYVVFRFWKLPSSVLIYDNGTAITVYGKS